MIPLLFMHIHKTGGQSLSQFLERFFAPEEICPHNTDHSILAHTSKQLSQYKFFRGHISIHGLSQRIPAFSTVTVLRNPRERLISAFYYWQRAAMHGQPNLPPIMKRFASMTFEEFLLLPETYHCSDNIQARLIAGGRFGTTNDERIMVYGDPYPLHKDRFSYVGKTEELNAAAAALCEIFGFKPPVSSNGVEVERINIGTKPSASLSPREEELIAARTKHDWALYNTL